MSEIKPVAWTIEDQLEKVNSGRIGFIANRDMITPAADIPLYDQSAIDRMKAERDDALAAADFLEVEMAKFQIAADTAMAERDAAVADAERWNEFCRQVDLTIFPYSILDDAMAMGAGALELYIDEAMKEQEQGK